MDIHLLKSFTEIYRAGSVSFAAQNLSITQPALTQQMQLLERELKTQLFDRSRKGMRPTAAGEKLYAHAREILARMAELETTFEPSKQTEQITFAVGETLASHFIPGLLTNLRRTHPRTRFRVVESHLTEIRRLLAADEVDFAFLPEKISERQYENYYLMEDEILPVTIHDFKADLKNADWILFSQGAAIRKITDSIFEKAKIDPKIAMELRSVAGVVHCLEHGLGVGFISNLSLTEKLSPLKIAGLSRKRSFYLSVKRRHKRVADVVAGVLSYRR